MPKAKLSLVVCFLFLVLATSLIAAQTADLTSVPRLVKFTGSAPTGTAPVTFAIYATEDGLAPLWLETQTVTADESGHYTALLGSTKSDGLPASIFASGEARWIGVKIGDGPESLRTLLVSVPYALKAGDAETLGGKPLSAFLLADSPSVSSQNSSTKSQRLKGSEASRANPETFGTGDTGSLNFVGKFTANGLDAPLAASSIFDNGNVGIGTAAPSSSLHVRGTSNTYLTIDSSGNNTLDRGIRFLDQAGNPAAFLITTPNTTGTNSAMNFYVGGATANDIKLSINNNGNVGYGTLNPSSPLHVRGTGTNYIIIDSSGSNSLDRGIRFLNQAGVSAGLVALTPNTIGVNSQMYFYVGGAGASDVKLTLQNNGNVGFGTLTPMSPLHVRGSGSTYVIVDSSAGNTSDRGIEFLNQAGSPAGFITLTPNTVGTNSQMNFFVGGGSGSDVKMSLLNNGNVGISNLAPTAKLDVSQTAPGDTGFTIGTPPSSAIHGDTTATSGFITGILGTASSVDGFGVLGENLASGQGNGNSAGVRGITANTGTRGTGVWGDSLQSHGDNVGVYGRAASDAGTGVFGEAISLTGDTNGVFGRSLSSGGTGVFGEVTATTVDTPNVLYPAGVYGKANTAGAAGLFDVASAGADILIGRQGTTKKFRVDGNGAVFGNGAFNTSGADFAESVDVVESRSDYEPGDLIAIDTTGIRRFTKSAKPYSTLVAGIYSTKPGVLASPHPMDEVLKNTVEIPLAVVGIVPCKVTNENGDINAGDLLVASSTAGYAMKGTDRSKMTGAVVGKALQSMHGKNGVIEVLVSLQ